MDRLRRFWLTGVCKPHKQERQFSEPLATEQFLSAFLLLLSGIGLAVLLLALEHLYFRYVRSHLAKKNTGNCCSLISLVIIDHRLVEGLFTQKKSSYTPPKNQKHPKKSKKSPKNPTIMKKSNNFWRNMLSNSVFKSFLYL
jgi:hypothetical protein